MNKFKVGDEVWFWGSHHMVGTIGGIVTYGPKFSTIYKGKIGKTFNGWKEVFSMELMRILVKKNYTHQKTKQYKQCKIGWMN